MVCKYVILVYIYINVYIFWIIGCRQVYRPSHYNMLPHKVQQRQLSLLNNHNNKIICFLWILFQNIGNGQIKFRQYLLDFIFRNDQWWYESDHIATGTDE